MAGPFAASVFQGDSFQADSFSVSGVGKSPPPGGGSGLCDAFTGLAHGIGTGLIWQTGGLAVPGTGLTNNG